MVNTNSTWSPSKGREIPDIVNKIRNITDTVATGITGKTGATGAIGATGATGAGVAAGGTTGQVLVKNSNTNYDTTWATITNAYCLFNGAGVAGSSAGNTVSGSNTWVESSSIPVNKIICPYVNSANDIQLILYFNAGGITGDIETDFVLNTPSPIKEVSYTTGA
jgi:hypothetical protein